MKTHPVTTQSILRKISAAGRSSLYRWLAENHDGIAEATISGRVIGWSKLVEDFAAVGLLDGSGKPPSPQSARKTWAGSKPTLPRPRRKGGSGGQPPSAPFTAAIWLAAAGHGSFATDRATGAPALCPPGTAGRGH